MYRQNAECSPTLPLRGSRASEGKERSSGGGFTTAGAVKGIITYTYDAAGNKLKKVTLENNAIVSYNGTNYTTNITTTTTYTGGSGVVYESKDYSHASLVSLDYPDRLQFIGHEEGRIRLKQVDGSFAFDYFLKGHLGNVRMVLTEELQTDMYPACQILP